MNLVEQLICPNCHLPGLHLAAATPYKGLLPKYGDVICIHCASRYPITEQILDLVPPGSRLPLTLAGESNNALLAPYIYEHLWRPRALTWLTGKAFPEAQEIALLAEWASVAPGQLVLDIGTSTGLYARGLARVTGTAGAEQPVVVAIDLARGMLQAARHYARREGIDSLAYLRTPAERLPFADASVDVIVCGGSLNEFRSIPIALCEMQRVIKPEGRIVAMSLLEAEGGWGRLSQRVFVSSGIKFPTQEAFNQAVNAAGLTVTRQEIWGIVAFSLMQRTR